MLDNVRFPSCGVILFNDKTISVRSMFGDEHERISAFLSAECLRRKALDNVGFPVFDVPVLDDQC